MRIIRYSLCVLYVLLSVSGLTLIKLASLHNSNTYFVVPILNVKLSWISLIGLFCYGLSFCVYLGVVNNFQLGFIIPLLGGIVNILIVIMSILLLKENLSVNAIIGGIVIIVGIFIMNFTGK